MDGFGVGGTILEIVMLRCKAIDEFSRCKMLDGLFARDKDVKLVLRCLVWLRPNKLASRASMRPFICSPTTMSGLRFRGVLDFAITGVVLA